MLLVTLLVAVLAMSKKSVGQFDIVEHANVNPFLKKDATAPATAGQFAADLKAGKSSAYLRVSNAVYLTTATKAVNGSKAESRMGATMSPENVLYMFEHCELENLTVEQLKGVYVLGVKPGDTQFGMFPAYKAGSYAVFTDENGNEIVLYKAGCLNICVDNREIEKPLASTASSKKEAVYTNSTFTPVPPTTTPSVTYNVTNSFNTTTASTYTPPAASNNPINLFVDEDDDQCCTTTTSQPMVIMAGGNRGSGVNVGLNVGATFAGGHAQQPRYQYPPYQQNDTWTPFTPPPVGGEGYGGGTYTGNGGYGSGTTVPISGDGGYGGGTYTGFN